MNKKVLAWGILSGILLITGTALAFLIDRPSDEYERYQSWSTAFDTGDWLLTEETTVSFAESNCFPLFLERRPVYRIQSEDHLKATAAVLAAYCPDSVMPYMRVVDRYYPGEYSETTDFIRKVYP